MEAVVTIAPPRRPWLGRLIAEPAAQVRALAEGTADIAPFGRAEPSDAAATLLFGLSEDDPALQAFDEGTLATLETYRETLRSAAGAQWDRTALAALDLMTVIQRLAPRNTVINLHRRFPYWNNWAETLVLDRGFDLRREYWRVLALTQDIAEGAGLEARRLLPFWLNVCGEAGRRGLYDESYLTVGLLGLRRLPLDQDGANEEAALHGLARWAEAQRPGRKRFLREWQVLEEAFPRDPTYWTPLVGRVLNSVETELGRRTKQAVDTFPAAEWWRKDLDLIRGSRVEVPDSWISPPPISLVDRILEGIRNRSPFRQMESAIAGVISKHQRYATRTGDTYYLMRTACNIGTNLLKGGDEPLKRAEKACDLARMALHFEPFDVYAWALWRDSLAELGHLDAAELVGWEAIRRFPENKQWRNQLALLLGDRLDRPAEAETLLRETIRQIPGHAVARTQYTFLQDTPLGRVGEAEALLRETIPLFSDDVVVRHQLAAIIGREKERLPEAISIIDEALRIDPENRIVKNVKIRFEEGRTAKPPPTNSRVVRTGDENEGNLSNLPSDIVAMSRVRRALFRLRNGQPDAVTEVRRLLREDENLAYARYVAAAAGVIEPSVNDTVLASAFLAAAKAGSAAALHALIGRSHGIDAFIVTIASATQGDEDAASRVKDWLAEPANDLLPRDAGVRSIASRPLASIPMDLLGDMLAASLVTAFAA